MSVEPSPGTATVAEDLRRRLAELSAINAIGIAVGSTLDVDHVVERGLAEIVARLGFGRGLIALVHPASETVGACRVAGLPASSAEATALEALTVRVDDPEASLAALARADGPLRFRDVDTRGGDPNAVLARALDSTGYVGTPLVTQGRVVGVLVVRDARDGRPIEPTDGPLLYTVGSQVAGSIESARLYAELEAQNRALEARVAARTADLAAATAEAQAARAVAEDANEAKSRFLANVSHELRTPLTSVVGFAKLDRRRLEEVVFPAVPREDPKVERAMRQVGETLGIIVEEGDRLTGLINDLLDLAKIEAGRFEWRPEPLRLEDVVGQALAATGSLVEAAGLDLAVDVEPDLPDVVGDRARLVQVVINLVSNAVKFTPSGAVRVAVARDGDGVRVVVTDTGRGIAAEDVERIFEPFRQASDTVADGPRGTGLGLPISRQIVEAHGGELGGGSSPGTGSTFWFRLPRAGSGPAMGG